MYAPVQALDNISSSNLELELEFKCSSVQILEILSLASHDFHRFSVLSQNKCENRKKDSEGSQTVKR